MKKNILVSILGLSLSLLISCQKNEYGSATVNIKNLQIDFINWWEYQNDSIHLSRKFTPLDEDLKIIEKRLFLEQLNTGKYIPIKLKSNNSIPFYQLYLLDSFANSSIKSAITDVASWTIQRFDMEGTKFPTFNFTDLKGSNYSNASTNGKIVVLKTWFINCAPCIQEMPELNKIVKQYENREDIIFISLARDSSDKLTKFLKKVDFDYKVIPKQKNFIEKSLNITSYPTHIIIGKDGIIKKVNGEYYEMYLALKELINN